MLLVLTLFGCVRTRAGSDVEGVEVCDGVSLLRGGALVGMTASARAMAVQRVRSDARASS